MKKYTLLICALIALCGEAAAAVPRLNFSDLIAGPKTGNTDGLGSGAIVTVWGNNLGSSQGASKIYIGGTEAAHIYYWKDADGQLPGGPSDLKTYHKMQEICFSVPSGATDGANTIKVTVGGVDSNTLPFTVRGGNIYFIKSTGNDSTGDGSWTSPWLSLNGVLSGDDKIAAGDTVYSVGVGYNGQVVVGSAANITGALDNQVAVLAYPNTTVSIVPPQWLTAIKNYSRGTPTTGSSYFVFSKLTIDTKYEAFSLFAFGRYIGNYITGALPSSSQSLQYSGAIGGNCTASTDTAPCSGHKILGNEIENYGDVTGTNNGHHLFYISNRSGATAEAYEIGWTYAHNNTAYQGLHIYDMSPGGGWTGTFKIHDNVVKNQSGNAINMNAAYTGSYEIYNNLLVLDVDYDPNSGQFADPAACFRVDADGGNFEIYNNTCAGYAASNAIATNGAVEFRNNIVVDNRNLAYVTSAVPAIKSNNLFFSTANASLATPAWFSLAAGDLNVDPEWQEGTYIPNETSPLVAAGYDLSSLIPYDLLGLLRGSTPAIGAFEFAEGATVPSSALRYIKFGGHPITSNDGKVLQ